MIAVTMISRRNRLIGPEAFSPCVSACVGAGCPAGRPPEEMPDALAGARFLDLGSGDGRAVIAAALLVPELYEADHVSEERNSSPPEAAKEETRTAMILRRPFEQQSFPWHPRTWVRHEICRASLMNRSCFAVEMGCHSMHTTARVYSSSTRKRC